MKHKDRGVVTKNLNILDAVAAIVFSVTIEKVGDISIKIASSEFWLLVAQSLLSEDALATFGNGFPVPSLLHKYGTETTYVCTWDLWRPFPAKLEGGAGCGTSPGLLYTSWFTPTGFIGLPPLS